MRARYEDKVEKCDDDDCDDTDDSDNENYSDECDDSYLTAGLRCAPDMGPATRTPIRTPKPLKIIVTMTMQYYQHHHHHNDHHQSGAVIKFDGDV